MQELQLPDDLHQFLEHGKSLAFDPKDCETGAITFHSLSDLSLSEFHLQTYATPIEKDDPNVGESGVYVVPAVSLLSDCQKYGADFLLVWLPEEKKFGSGDEEHGHLIVFANATWSDIMANPVSYLEAQWNEGGEFGEYLRPWDKYPFVNI